MRNIRIVLAVLFIAGVFGVSACTTAMVDKSAAGPMDTAAVKSTHKEPVLSFD